MTSLNKKMILCPFCASTDLDVYCIDDGWNDCGPKREEVWAVECGHCLADGPWASTNDEAVEKWNNRF